MWVVRRGIFESVYDGEMWRIYWSFKFDVGRFINMLVDEDVS